MRINPKLLESLRRLLKHQFFTGSLIMLAGGTLYNAGQFVFHSFSARFLEKVHGEFLGKVYYGDIATIVSVWGLVAIVQLSLGLTVVKFIASEKNHRAVKNLSKWVLWWAFWIGLLIAFFILLVSPFLTKFFNFSQPMAFYLLAPALFVFSMLSTGRSILQGVTAFKRYVFSLLVEVGFKISLTVVFIFAGLAVYGAMFAILTGVFISLLVTWLGLLEYLRGPRGNMPEIAPILKYSFPVLVQGLALTSMYTADLLLVKHFFPAAEAGLYASLAMLGRVVFFGSSPITQVMFPLIARRKTHGVPYHNIFYLSVLLVGGFSALLTLFYLVFPKLPIILLFGHSFLAGAPLLVWFGIFMGLLAVATLFIQFYLSVGKTKVAYLFLIAALLQVVLIWFFHSSLLSVIQNSIVAVTLLVICLIIYFPYHHRK